MTAPGPQLLLRPQEAANALGISLRTVMAMVGKNEIPFVRLGERNLRFPLEGLRHWVASRTTWPTELATSEQPQAGDQGDKKTASGRCDKQQPEAVVPNPVGSLHSTPDATKEQAAGRGGML